VVGRGILHSGGAALRAADMVATRTDDATRPALVIPWSFSPGARSAEGGSCRSHQHRARGIGGLVGQAAMTRYLSSTLPLPRHRGHVSAGGRSSGQCHS
jgi:hypothetical protein